LVEGASQAVIPDMAKGEEVRACLVGKKVLVTGATGFVGSHLVGQLVSLGANVVAAGAGMGWRPIVRTLVRQGQLQYIDLRTFWHPASLRRVMPAFEGVEYVVHLAYEMPRGTTLAEKAVDDNLRNVVGTLRLICCLPDSVKKICFSSSVSVYGSRSLEPVGEGEWPQPGTVYAVGKLATEQYLQQHALERNISLTILRYATIYGPLETDPRAIPNFIRQVLAGKPPVIRGDGEDVRDYVHVDDVVQATISALSFLIKDVKIYNVGSGKGHSTRQIAEFILRLTGDEREPIFKREEISTSGVICDISAARTLLGYSPKVELERGLRDEIEWFRRNPRFWQN
jgi:nucleoside-diphosphate-sugar epimerase